MDESASLLTQTAAVQQLTKEMETSTKSSPATQAPASTSTQESAPTEVGNKEIRSSTDPADAVEQPPTKLQAMKPSALIEIDDEELAMDRDFDLVIPSRTPIEQRTQGIALIFAKYGLQYAADEMFARPKPQVERVERKPRMRVHYTCHECNTTFGIDRACRTCNHQRCRDCSRYPPKKKNKAKAKRAPAITEPVKQPSPPNLTTGPCHECQTEFSLGDLECANCHHKICEKCLSEAIEIAS